MTGLGGELRGGGGYRFGNLEVVMLGEYFCCSYVFVRYIYIYSLSGVDILEESLFFFKIKILFFYNGRSFFWIEVLGKILMLF